MEAFIWNILFVHADLSFNFSWILKHNSFTAIIIGKIKCIFTEVMTYLWNALTAKALKQMKANKGKYDLVNSMLYCNLFVIFVILIFRLERFQISIMFPPYICISLFLVHFYITWTHLCCIYWEFYNCKHDKIQMKICNIFLISVQNIDCGYILEWPDWGCSNMHPQPILVSSDSHKFTNSILLCHFRKATFLLSWHVKFPCFS